MAYSQASKTRCHISFTISTRHLADWRSADWRSADCHYILLKLSFPALTFQTLLLCRSSVESLKIVVVLLEFFNKKFEAVANVEPESEDLIGLNPLFKHFSFFNISVDDETDHAMVLLIIRKD
jgi:hypothetical protein